MVQIANPGGNFPTLNGSLPCEGTKVFPFNLDFNAANAYNIDLTQAFNQKQFTTLQTVYIDNALNPSSLEIICSTTGQQIIAPPFSQGFYIMLQPSPPKFSVQTSGVLVLEIILLNFYIPPAVWIVGTSSVDIPALDAIIANGGLNVNTTPSTLTGMTDRSGTIAVGGTRQPLFALNPAAKRRVLHNPSSAAEVLQFSWTTNVAGLIDLLPGQTWDESNATIVGDGWWVVGATIAHAFTAYEK